MRRGRLVFFLVAVLILFSLAINTLFTLITLLFEDASADAIHWTEIPALNSSSLTHPPPQLIPKIIHQTYKTSDIPAKWAAAQKSCRDLHPDYEYVFWTDAKSREFVAKEYPWFLDTFDTYRYNIQRADAIRYFALVHYGGVYIDLDDGCKRRLDPLLSHGAWLRRTIPTGISNDAMGATPQHPFFLRVIHQLEAHNRNFLLPYITIMGSTGPLFLSLVWKTYVRDHLYKGPAWTGRVRILTPSEYSNNAASFFKIYKGSSWHRADARLIFWMGQHWMFLTAAGVALAAVICLGGWWVYRRIVHNVGLGMQGQSGSPVARLGVKWRFRQVIWERWTWKPEYKLVDGHNA